MTTVDLGSADEWRQAVSTAFYPLEVERVGRDFGAQMTTAAVGRGVQVAEVRSAPNSLTRTTQLVRKAPSDDVLLLVQTAGRTTVRQEDRVVLLDRGAATLCDPVTAYSVQADTSSVQLVITMPRSVVRALAAPVDSLRLRRMDQGLLPLRALTGLAEAATTVDDTVSFGEADALGGAIIDLTRAAFTRLSAGRPTPVGRDAAVRAVHQYVRDHAADTDLDVERLAAAFGVTVRRLASLLGEGTSPGRLIRGERLTQARRRLMDPLDGARSIGDVARLSGFADLTTFTRAFRREFGQLPSELERPGPH